MPVQSQQDSRDSLWTLAQKRALSDSVNTGKRRQASAIHRLTARHAPGKAGPARRSVDLTETAMYVIVYADEEADSVCVGGPYVDEDAAQEALDAFAEANDQLIDVESYEIVAVRKKLKV